MRILLVGAPGSGKGTQAKLLQKTLGVVHISTGDRLRAELKTNSEVGQKAQHYMNQGQLVPDAVMIELLEKAIAAEKTDEGFILDGYPRNLSQAINLEELLKKMQQPLDLVIYLKIPTKLLEERLTGRRVSVTSGREYHVVFKPPKLAGKCDVDGSDLVQRPDDQLSKVQVRIGVFETETKPLIEFYQSKGLLREIDASVSIDLVAQKILELVSAPSIKN